MYSICTNRAIWDCQSGYRDRVDAGRDRSEFGVEACMAYGSGDERVMEQQVRAFEGLGVSHLSINTMRAGLETPQDHLRAIERFAKVMGLES